MKATTARAIYDAVKDKPQPARAALDAGMSEAEFRNAVCDLLTAHKWRWSYTPDSRMVQGHKGIPDIIAVRNTHDGHARMLFAELKTEKGKVSPAQKAWMGDLVWAVHEVYLWKPSNMADIESVLA